MLFDKPVLYSFRRCPYAIRARLALKLCGVDYELREVDLKSKPKSMLKFSPKGTVPVFILPDGRVIDESLDIVRWVVDSYESEVLYRYDLELKEQSNIIYSSLQEDLIFHLNRYKYPDRYENVNLSLHREKINNFLLELESRLSINKFILGPNPTEIDILVFPFVRQVNIADSNILTQDGMLGVRKWFFWWVNSSFFKEIMIKFPICQI
jgi:glutathione S-transferase